jgi:hypothetical protein
MADNDRRDLVAQMKNRALVYMEIYEVLAAELDEARAEELLTRAIYRRGRAMGKNFAQYGPGDLEGLRTAFLGSVPGGQSIFQPEVLKRGGAELEIQLHGCPLKDAWREAGLSETKVATLCRLAGAVDKGLFEGAGFRFENRTWTPGAQGCCFLHVERG